MRGPGRAGAVLRSRSYEWPKVLSQYRWRMYRDIRSRAVGERCAEESDGELEMPGGWRRDGAGGLA